ncbi:hypothetical protein SAMN05216210_2540 [Halopseudomonas salegens]|uniref:Uncharacterized protein n=1 Tax=Halopseudomonas salegens TaxID=1434072 RepID=A0A1H2GTJ8_9GAMM|nr:hypothetical protein SAMN05216210_2540 [Halopseudomonas salegens]
MVAYRDGLSSNISCNDSAQHRYDVVESGDEHSPGKSRVLRQHLPEKQNHLRIMPDSCALFRAPSHIYD